MCVCACVSCKDSEQSNYRYKVVTRGRTETEMEISEEQHLVPAPCKLVSRAFLPTLPLLLRSYTDSSRPDLLSHSVHAPLISRLADRPRQTKNVALYILFPSLSSFLPILSSYPCLKLRSSRSANNFGMLGRGNG